MPSKVEAKSVKELNARIEKLETLFTKGLSELKSASNAESDQSTVQELDNSVFGEKLKQFENIMKLSLKEIKNDLGALQAQVDKTVRQVNNFHAQQNSNMLIIYGISENDDLNIYENVLNIFSNKLNVNIAKTDIKYCYRLGQKIASKKSRPVLIEFVHRWMRDQLFYSKRNLKGTKILIVEKLSSHTLELFKKVRDKMGQSSWTYGGTIYVLINDTKIAVRTEEQWLEICAQMVNT